MTTPLSDEALDKIAARAGGTDVPALIAELRACREGMTTLILTANLLYANSLACVEQHHGSHEGTPPWLADCWRSIEAARALIPAERKK